MRPFAGDAYFRQALQNRAALDLKLSRQFVDTNMSHLHLSSRTDSVRNRL